MRIEPVEILILQLTSFCNLDCSYCYLPHRRRRSIMPESVVAKTCQRILEEKLQSSDTLVNWHAGEPLAFPKNRFAAILDQFNEFAQHTRITHSIQTNGTLIDDEWCEIFRAAPVTICVSVDGAPETHDANRRNWAGRGTLRQTLSGIDTLRRNDIAFSTLSVVTPRFLQDLRKNVEFLLQLGGLGMAFNVEEVEGVHTDGGLDSAVSVRDMASNWREVLGIAVDNDAFCREFWAMVARVTQANRRNIFAVPYTVLTVLTNGDFGSHSPELVGNQTSRYDRCILGNVFDSSLSAAAEGPLALRLRSDIASGIAACASSCEYFSVCGGGSPSNKIFEHGDARSTETGYCRSHIKALVNGFIELSEQSPESLTRHIRAYLRSSA